jgi:hypothetical protein
MADAFALLLGFRAIARIAKEREGVEKVPEPEFVPFKLPSRPTDVEAVAPANTAHQRRTLAELGVPGGLASEMELWFGLLGATRGDEVVGYTFRTPDGATHALRLSPAAAAPSTEGEGEGADRAA